MTMTLNFSTLSIPLITILPLLTYIMHLNISSVTYHSKLDYCNSLYSLCVFVWCQFL